MSKRIASGYSPEGKPVYFELDDGTLYVVDSITGECERFNDEYYEEDFDFRFMLISEGYRF